MNKRAAIILIVTLIASLILLMPRQAEAESKTIVVPNDYPKISAAIGNASTGDTILVKNGNYNDQSLEITKPLTIISEHPYQAKISLNPSQYPMYYRDQNLNTTYYAYNNAISIKADNVVLSGFVLTSSGGLVSAIGNGLQITNNIVGCDSWLTGNGTNTSVLGALLVLEVDGSNNVVSNNSVWTLGINGSLNSVMNNSASSLSLVGSQNTIAHNLFKGQADSGIVLDAADHNVISKNNINGLQFVNGSANLFYENRIEGGIDAYGLQTSRPNSFDNGSVGNYWSDYSRRYPNATELDGSGIWNTPYLVYGNILDSFPLTNSPTVPDAPLPQQNTTTSQHSEKPNGSAPHEAPPEPFPWLPVAVVSVVVAAVVAVAAVVYLKKRKH